MYCLYSLIFSSQGFILHHIRALYCTVCICRLRLRSTTTFHGLTRPIPISIKHRIQWNLHHLYEIFAFLTLCHRG